MLQEFVLSILMSFPVWKYDRGDTEEERRALLTPTATAITIVANESDNPMETAAILSMLSQRETGLARFILEGRCKDGPPGIRCDWKGGRPRARGPFQVWDWCKKAWALPAASVAGIAEGGRCALALVKRSLKACKRSRWPGAYARYRGQKCSDGPRTDDPNKYKGLAYYALHKEVHRRLKAMEADRSRRFHELLRSLYGEEKSALLTEGPEQRCFRPKSGVQSQ
jgi:hypothetical protein